MAHFIVTPFGSAGDVHPFVAVALALQQRGHRITFVTNGYFEDLIRRVGLPYRELGTRDEFLRLANHPDLWHPLKSFPYIFRQGIAPLMRDHYKMLAEYAQDEGAVVLSSALGFGAIVAQEKLQIPTLSLHLQPSVLCSDVNPPEFPGAFGPVWLRRLQYRIGKALVLQRVVGPTLNAWRSELGLAPVRDVTQWWHSSRGVVCLFPEWFAHPEADWPTPLRQTPFPLWDEASVHQVPAELSTFLEQGEPPLIFTPGSANQFGQAFFRAAVAATAQLGRRAIFLTRFPDQLPSHLPHTIRHWDYIPLSYALRRCAGLIHHGGIGTTAQALAAGVPQVIVALAHDQFDNGVRVRRLGVGEMLAAMRLSPWRLTKTLGNVLSSPQGASNCRDIASKCQGHDGPRDAALAIEQLAGVARKES